MPVKGAGARSGLRPPTRLARLIWILCRLPGPEVHGALAILGAEDVGNIGGADRSHSFGIQASLLIKGERDVPGLRLDGPIHEVVHHMQHRAHWFEVFVPTVLVTMVRELGQVIHSLAPILMAFMRHR